MAMSNTAKSSMASAAPTGSGQLDAYLAARPRLIRLAYRFVGSMTEAEDIVQEAWLRFADAKAVQHPDRYLSRIVSNLSLDRLRSAQHRRETYVGPWLPEPILAAADMVTQTDPSEAALDISYAVMCALERLSPLERAALFLHDLFDVPFDEVAETLDRSASACRQLASRARKTIQQDIKRFPTTEQHVDRFVAGMTEAMTTGSLAPLEKVLSDDIELVSDGGGKALASRRILRGRDAVARFFLGISRGYDPRTMSLEPATINGQPGLIIREAGAVTTTLAFGADSAGQIDGIYVVRNPDKLTALPS